MIRNILIQSAIRTAVVVVAFTISTTGAWAENDAPEQLDLANFPGEIVDKVVVPIPAEIFAVLDKLGEPEWSNGISILEEQPKTNDRAILALTFGSLIGEGFIAVQAKDKEKIKTIGHRVLNLSESLGLANAVRAHSLGIIEAADRRDWDQIRRELDDTQRTVRETMERLRDEEMSGLVSLGGWLRGTNVVTRFIGEAYSEDKAELLNQPGLIVYFREMLASMEGPSKSSSEIRAISTGLARLEGVITGAETFSEEDINELHDISQTMLEEFYFVPVTAEN